LFFRKKKRLVLIEEFFAVTMSTGHANIWSYWGRTLLETASNSYKIDIIFSTLMVVLTRYRPLYPHSTLTSQDGFITIAHFYFRVVSKGLSKIAFVYMWSLLVAVVFLKM
jgi:hypothetical protein